MAEQLSRDQREDLLKADLDYRYPEGLDLRPSSEFHKELVGKIVTMATKSHDAIRPRFNKWNEIDEKLTGYIPVKQAERLIKQQDRRKPVGVVLPTTFAALDTIRAYLLASLMGPPIFRYDGVGDEDLTGAACLEKVIDWQCRKFRTVLALSILLRDSLCYGMGPGSIGWDEHWGYAMRPVVREPSVLSLWGGDEATTEYERQKVLQYEGNVLTPIDPYLALPDPNTPIHQQDDGNYFGWMERANRLRLLEMEANDPDMFNCKYLEAVDGRMQEVDEDPSARNRDNTVREQDFQNSVQDLICMPVRLVPSEWKLGDSTEPEKWLFWVAGKSIIIKLARLPYNHNRIPVVVGAPDFDGHTIAPISRLEMCYGMQEFNDFMINSIVENQRKCIKGQWIANSRYIDVERMLDPQHGGILWMNDEAAAMGVKPKDIVDLFPVPHVTGQNIPNIAIGIDQLKEGIGATDQLMGKMRRNSAEITAEEAHGARQGALGRMGGLENILRPQLMQPMGEMFGYNTQQFMSEAVWIAVTGRHSEKLNAERYGERRLVRKEEIQVAFDIFVNDGLTPQDISPSSFLQIMQAFQQDEELRMTFSIPRLGVALARAAGFKSPEDYLRRQDEQLRLQTMMMSDEAAAEQHQRGNLVTPQELEQAA